MWSAIMVLGDQLLELEIAAAAAEYCVQLQVLWAEKDTDSL
jgi:hypothetical protein